MKRVTENVEGGSEDLGLKKVRYFNEVDENCGALERNEGEQDGVHVGNERIGYATVDRNEILFEDTLFDNLGGLESNNWDFDLSFDSYFRNEEEQKRVNFDLNVPVDGGPSEFAQGPIIKENKVVEIIDITSDNSDSDVEVIGFNQGYNNGKNKLIEPEMPHDGIYSLSLGLGMITVENNFIGESSLVDVGERRYTWEEKGKASVVDNSWLSLKANDSRVFNLDSDSDESIRTIDPVEDVVEVDNGRSELAERALRQAEEALSYRNRLYQQAWRETAKQFARVLPDKKHGDEKENAPTSSALEQLGKSSGPFGEALKIVRGRISKKKGVQELIEWKPSQETEGRSLNREFIPSLLDLSLKALAENAEGIMSLEFVPDNLRRRLTDLLCDMRKMNVHILEMLLEGRPTDIRVKNCAWLTEKQFQLIFGKCQTEDLRVLQLDLCGQIMLDFAFRQILAQSTTSFSSLAIVSLRGACRLSDNGLKDLAKSAPSLQSLNLSQCTLLTDDAVNCIAEFLGSNLKELYIDDCNKINAKRILPAFKKFTNLEVLSVAGLRTVTDQFVSEMVSVCGRSIKELDLADCLELTDISLKCIGSSCADLRSLNISNLNKLTDFSLEFLANGCRSIRKFKLCRNDFSDEAMAALLESSGESLTELLLNNVKQVGPHTALSLAKRSRKLLSLDISWCRRISSEALGLIVDSCSSLKLLKVFGCRQITSVFLNGHSNPSLRIIGLDLTTPLLEHVNLLEPQDVLLRHSPLTICAA